MAIPLTDRIARQASGRTERDFDPIARDEPRLLVLPVSAIDPDPNQPRRDLGDLADLALSIQEHGLVQPIVVEAMPPDRYRILAGERRFAACGKLGWAALPCIVRTVEEQSRLALQIIENIHRKALDPIEEAQALRRLMNEFNLSQGEVGKRIGRSKSSVNQTLRILDIPPEMLAEVRASGLPSKSALLEFAKEADPDRQRALCEQAKAGELTVWKARATPPPPPKAESKTMRIVVADATIQVQFDSGDASPERVVEALQAALGEVAARNQSGRG
ncbi:MAG: ParB/RepB/Spo0J family partition protein [Limisphaerales bacterium]